MYKKMIHKITMLTVAIASLAIGSGMGAITTYAKENVQSANVESFDLDTKIYIEKTYVDNSTIDYADVPSIIDFIDSSGNYHVAYTDNKNVYITIYSNSFKKLKEISIKNELDMVGNIIQDNDGYYYIVYGESGKERDITLNDVVLLIAKYDSNGKLINKLSFKGNETAYSGGDSSFGTILPFYFSNCDLAINKDGVLVTFYGRYMENGHQSSHAIYVDTSTMTRVNYKEPYTSHSFKQDAIADSNGNFILTDMGDAYRRGFNINLVNKYNDTVNSIVPFYFSNNETYQTVHANLAGVAELSNGYALIASSEKSLTYDLKPETFNESKNLFMQVISKDFTSGSESPSIHMISGVTRVPEGTYKKDEHEQYLPNNVVNNGIRWLTDYTGNESVESPKMVQISDKEVLIMWEKREYYRPEAESLFEQFGEIYDYKDLLHVYVGRQVLSDYIDTYYMVVTMDGNIKIPATSLNGVRLSDNQDIIYHNGYIYWSISDYIRTGNDGFMPGEIEKMSRKGITVNRFKIGDYKKPTLLKSIAPSKTEITVNVGEKISLNLKPLPESADMKNLIYSYNLDYMSRNDKGEIIAKVPGKANIIIWDYYNPYVYTSVTVNIKTPALKIQNIDYDFYSAITFDWKKTYVEGMDYEIYRSTKKSSGYKLMDTVKDYEYLDNTFTYNNTYYYKVRLVNTVTGQKSSFSNILVMCPLKYIEITKRDKETASSFRVTWKQNKHADGYEVYSYNVDTGKRTLVKVIKNNKTVSYTIKKPSKNASIEPIIRAYKVINKVKYYSDFK